MQKSLRQNKDAAALGYMQQILNMAFQDFYANPSKITRRAGHLTRPRLIMDLVQGLYCLNTGTLIPDFPVPLTGVASVVVPGVPATVAVVDAVEQEARCKQLREQCTTSGDLSRRRSTSYRSHPSPPRSRPRADPSTSAAQYGPFYEFHIEPSTIVHRRWCWLAPASMPPAMPLVNGPPGASLITTATGPLATGNVRFGNIEIINQDGALDLTPLGLDCSGLPIVPATFLPEGS